MLSGLYFLIDFKRFGGLDPLSYAYDVIFMWRITSGNLYYYTRGVLIAHCGNITSASVRILLTTEFSLFLFFRI